MGVSLAGLDHVALGVSDQAASVVWYRRLLGLVPVFEEEWRGVPAMVVGPDGTGLALFQAGEGRATGFRHVAFRVDREQYEAAKTTLAAEGIALQEQDHDVSWSIYFRDPDGVELELTTYER